MTQKKVGSVAVIGAGIAGIQSSLDLADAGFKVHLVEKSPAIGGVMSSLDKTFPTNDCAMCILSPKLVEVGRCRNVNLVTNAEVIKVEGELGNFKIHLARQPRYIDTAKCTACGECATACPVELPNLFDQGLSLRKAIYKKYPQAIPSAFGVEKADIAPCRMACPARLNVQGYVQMVKQGKYRQALEIIMEDLPLPGVLGRICPHGCEDACRRKEVDAPVSIRNLKRLAADQFDPRKIHIACLPERPEKVAIIGSGPAGLSAAYQLAIKGIKSTIFEALTEAGGMLRVGIPAHRLPRNVLDEEIEVITNIGVTIKTNTPLGPGLTIENLRNQGFSAVYLALGAHKGIEIGIPGENSRGVRQGVDFLREVNLTGKAALGKNVAIIGGGNVAIDVARCALRLGAETVNIIYRRTRNEMPAWEEEIAAAEAEGTVITYLSAPREILISNGRVSGLRCIRMELTEPDSSGRRRPVPIPDSEYDIEIDHLLPAIGQRPDLSAIEDVTGLTFTRWGTLETDPVTYATGCEGVFAGGDLQTGPWVAIGAIAAGKVAAESIVRYLDGMDMTAGRPPLDETDAVLRPIPSNEPVIHRMEMPELSPASREGNFLEVELGFNEEAGRVEAGRCLNCGYCCECYQCVEACGPQAVTIETHRQQAETDIIHAGAIILSPGYQTFNPSVFERYGYGVIPDVITSMEFERILSASGPFEGHVVKPSNHQEPRKIAWLQCVGSRDTRTKSHSYCSGVCCMYAIKQAIIAKEHDPGLSCTIFFMDIRTHGKGFEACYNEAKERHGINFVRCNVHSVMKSDGENPIPVLDYVDEASGQKLSEAFDIVVLSVGMETTPEVKALARDMGVDLTDGGFCQTDSFNPVSTSVDGVYVCGALQGPKDIPQSVIEAGAASLSAGVALTESRNTLTQSVELPPEIDISGDRPRVGVFVCQCGINIGGVVDVPAVRDYAATLPYVEYVADNLYTCSQDTQDAITQVIKDKQLNRIIVAACTPRTHEPLFQETLMNAGLNKYLFEMVNIRNHCSWVHKNFTSAATDKAKDLVRMAVAKVAQFEPLKEAELLIDQSAMVIGGGLSGMAAAKALADQGYPVHLVEKELGLGGQARNLFKTAKGEDIQRELAKMIREIESHRNISLHLGASLKKVEGFVGNFDTTIAGEKNETILHHGVTIVATGAFEYEPDEYLYGKDPRVITGLELDRMFVGKDPSLEEIQTAVFIQCVGSREPQRPYCSRICCTHAVLSALHLKEKNPDARVFILYRDMRTYGEREALYQKAREKGIIFIRYDLDNKPVVIIGDSTLLISVMDHILQTPVTIEADLLTLAAAVVPHKDEKLAQFFKVPMDNEGFFAEAHVKLAPSDFAVDGVFLCGLAHYPKPIDEAIAQAKAAASSATRLLAQKAVNTIGTVAYVDHTVCSHCGVCIAVCPFGAPAFLTEGLNKGKADINAVLCKGCGSCVSSCRSGALHLKGFEDAQIMAMVETAIHA